MKNFKLKWHNYSLSISCKKCGNNIPFGNFEGKPECDECHYVMSENWVEILRYVEIQTIKKHPQGHKNILGKFQARSNVEPISKIACSNCKSEIILNETTLKDQNTVCINCGNELPIKTFKEFPDFVFYGEYLHKNKIKSKTPVVLQCFTCAAPLKVIDNVVQLQCDSCGNDNVLSPSTGNEKIFSDIFIGLKVETFPPERIKEKSTFIIHRALLENKLESFKTEDLDKLLKNYPNEDNIFNAIHFTLKHRSSADQYLFLFENSTKQEIIRFSGKQLNKTQEEIQQQIEKHHPKINPSSSGKNKSLTNSETEEKGINWVVVMVSLVVITLIVVMTIYGPSSNE